MLWKNRSIGWKYSLVYVITIGLFLTSAGIITFYLGDVETKVNDMNEEVQHIDKLNAMEILIQERFVLLSRFMVAPDTTQVNQFNATVETFDHLAEAVNQRLSKEEEQQLFSVVVAQDQAIRALYQDYIQIRERDKTEQLNYITLRDAGRNYNQASFALNQLKAIADEDLAHDSAMIFTRFTDTRFTFLIAIMVSLVIGTVILVVVNREVSKKMRRITRFGDALMRGDLSSTPINVKGTDEFSRLGTILNNVQTTFKGMIERLSSVSTHLNEESTMLDEGARKLQTKNQDVKSHVSELKTAVHHQANLTDDIVKYSQTFNETIGLIEEESDAMRHKSKDVSNQTAQGIEVMHTSVAQINTMYELIAQSTKEIMKLKDNIGQVADLSALVNDIAKRTNLLSLNASIEAARAGEKGKGFAVVASEIRQLSQDVNASITDMNEVLTSIQLGAEEVSEVLVQSSEGIAKEKENMGYNIEVLQKMQQFIDQLIHHVDTNYASLKVMVNENQQLYQAIEEMQASSEQTFEQLQLSDQAIKEQRYGVEGIALQSEALKAESVQLSELIQTLHRKNEKTSE
ncbi:putative sensory transducer protein YvaQ [Halolactibacillus alkaliphilus]|uniref:Putative sensory transducer protein YvaQ n=1 Tax=Halolactibacillus alkaliphilus TaxID=442899 RepID=A0A511X069_9BACI|nr:methyl-accepting chemotaxis protein [Halolactibacillus alkaliphilus]GEN56347.1 putative sensory transducer protein YvaQ [Halolactibacillus alkaliphilus]GGN67590.1 putative sensory transducer protein YvaQ [Halolactibacillus alkaliphilus]SFO78674.1 methyl-accepting chemotaxis protein [Halolactibacillus alkaliphilus]